MQSSPTDLVASQDEYQKHVWSICLWPAQWETCDQNLQLSWDSVVLNSTHSSKVPEVTGLYSLVIQPGIANHLGCSYLMYLGKTKNLRRRFGEYLTSERTKRPKVLRLLEMYRGYIQFFYSKVDEAILDSMEEQLINAFVPPCNSKFTGELREARGAFQ